MPKIDGILETSLYVCDMERSVAFYSKVIGLDVMMTSPRLTAFDAGQAGVLLVFERGSTAEDIPTKGGVVPGHEGEGRLHMAFKISAGELEPWREYLTRSGVSVYSEVVWPAGGTSLYFHDPDGHVIELATPGLWANY